MLIILWLASMPVALAEESSEALLEQIGFEQIEALNGGDDGFDGKAIAQRLLAGEDVFDAEALRNWVKAEKTKIIDGFTGLFRRLLMPVGLCVALRALFDSSSGGVKLQDMLCCICCATMLLSDFELARQTAVSLMASANGAVGTIAPVISAAGAVTLGSASAALYPMTVECVDIMESVLIDTGLPVCALAAAVAAMGCVSERCSFDRLFALCRTVVYWMLGGAVLGYTAILGMQGMTGSALDGTVMKVVQSALERMIPIVGKDISGTTGTLSSGLGRLVGTVGLTGVLALLRLCGAPIAALFTSMLSIKLAGAVLEPIVGRNMARMLDRFALAHEMLLALSLCSVLLAALQVIGATALTGRFL